MFYFLVLIHVLTIPLAPTQAWSHLSREPLATRWGSLSPHSSAALQQYGSLLDYTSRALETNKPVPYSTTALPHHFLQIKTTYSS